MSALYARCTNRGDPVSGLQEHKGMIRGTIHMRNSWGEEFDKRMCWMPSGQLTDVKRTGDDLRTGK